MCLKQGSNMTFKLTHLKGQFLLLCEEDCRSPRGKPCSCSERRGRSPRPRVTAREGGGSYRHRAEGLTVESKGKETGIRMT